jgi:FKBP-type peptidyl-prolyl cis-trans isomerase 2
MEIVKVSFTGKIRDTGQVFDTTHADIAKKAGIFNENFPYGPSPMILGESRLIKGFENALSKMAPKEKKTVTIAPKDAYGERNSELVKLVPLNVFKANGINPVPGMTVVLDSKVPGRVQSVSSGRVRVDFNHELAGKTLEFDIVLEEKVADERGKVECLFAMVFQGVPVAELKINKTDKETELVLPKDCTKLQDLQMRKITLINNLKKYAGLDRIRITEEY